MRINDLTGQIIGAAVEVHRLLGPGLLDSAYEECLARELALRRIPFVRQHPLPVAYKGLQLECGYRLDLIVADLVVVELKAVEAILPIHEAQLLTYLRLSRWKIGLLINFNVPVLKDGICRRVFGQIHEPMGCSQTPSGSAPSVSLWCVSVICWRNEWFSMSR